MSTRKTTGNRDLANIAKSTTDYGIDAPPVIRNLVLGGAGALALRFGMKPMLIEGSLSGALPMLTAAGASFFGMAGAMLLYAKYGKFKHRDRMLAMIPWRGDEKVLDVGTGKGLLMIGAAKKLSTGMAYGIDIWAGKDLSSNNPDATLANAEVEGVRERVHVLSEDVRRLKFTDGMFDVILSNLCLHNIEEAAGRAEACREIARVLKPGGTALISDFMKLDEYVSAFERAGLSVRRSGPYLADTFFPLWIVAARRDGAA